MAKITKEQWVEIERRHLVDGVSLRELAKEYGVNESSLRRKLNPQNAAGEKCSNPLQNLAFDKVRIEKERRENAAQIAALPIVRQMIVEDLASKLINISRHTASGAEYGAMTFHRLAGIANIHAQEIDDKAPDPEALLKIAQLTDVGNKAAVPALNLLAANKSTVERINDESKISEKEVLSIDANEAAKQYQRIMG